MPEGLAPPNSFIGRQRELRELREALESTVSGRGRLVMLVGEPGIGKTRTAQELAAYAEKVGSPVLWGWCYEGEGAPPYWPWVQLLRSCILQKDSQQLRSEMGPGAANIAEIIPELFDKLPDLKPPPTLDSPEQARFRLFDSITSFLKNAAQTRPLALVLDDLHWADRPSLLLLHFLARHLTSSRLLLVGCYRDVELSRQHPLSEALAQLARQPVFQRLLLRGLSQEDAGRFIEVAVGAQTSGELINAIYTHTEGNPFFITEVVRSLRERGELDSSESGGPERIRIPEGVREVIGQRLNRLSEQCHQTLTVASIIGREFDFSQLNRLSSQATDEQLLAMLDEALEAHLIQELPGSAEGYQFSHALVQETLASELSAARRVRLHARIAEALEELYGASTEVHAVELAYHFSQARPVLGPEKLVKYSLIAGERALAVYAYQEALALFERGLVAKEGQPMDAETADLLFGLARAQLATVRSNNLGEAVATLRRAFDYYYDVTDIPRAVAVAEFPIQGGTLNLGRADIASRALSLVPGDSLQAGRLLFIFGFFLYQERGDYEGAREALGQALSIARREGDQALELRTLVGLGHVEAYHLHFRESLQYDLEAIELDNSVDDPYQATHAHLEVASVLQHLGDREGAHRHARVALTGAERLRNRMRLSQVLRGNMALAIVQGNWVDARDLSERGLSIMAADPGLLGYRALMEYALGDFDQGDVYLERLLEIMRTTSPSSINPYGCTALVVPIRAQVAGAEAYPGVAKAAAQVVLSYPGVTPVHASVARAGLALLSSQQGDVAGAKEQYAALESRSGTMLGGTFESAIAADRLLGLLSQTMGDPEQAASHFEDALAFSRQAGYRPELAWSCYEYARLLVLQGERQKALGLLDEARSLSADLGMKPLLNEAVALLAEAERQPPRAPKYPAGLTEREVEVLHLIAEGKTNSEMAAALVLSQRTVQRHISNLYIKINARNRAEATTYFLTHLNVSP